MGRSKSVIMVLLSLVSVLCGAHYLMLPFLLPSVFLPFLLLAVGRCVEVKVVGEVYTMHSTHCEGHGVNATKDARADGAGGVGGRGRDGVHGGSGGLAPDVDKVWRDLPLLCVSHGSGHVGDLDELAEGVDVLVAAGDLVAVAALLLLDVRLLGVVGHLVAVCVHRVRLERSKVEV